MSILICYEGWRVADKYPKIAYDLIELALKTSPLLTTARLSIVGGKAERECSIQKAFELIMKLPLGWSLTIYDPKKLKATSPFITSKSFFVLRTRADWGGFYLYGNHLDQFVDARSQFFIELIRIAGIGIGYCRNFANPEEAENYALDLQIMKSVEDLADVLRPRGATWLERLPTVSSGYIARNIFPINIWPKSYIEHLKNNSALYKLILSTGAKFIEISDDVSICLVPESDVCFLRDCMNNYIHEKRAIS